MARILGVGNATVDIVNVLDFYPAEDQECRAEAQYVSRGGNATNSLVVLSCLGHRCSWAGTIAADHYSRLIREDLDRYAIDLRYVREVGTGATPVSCITLNRANATRTIVHFRDLPEYGFQEFEQIDLARFDHLHFEGRAVSQLAKMLERVLSLDRRPGVSLEIEKPRAGIAALAARADLVLFSKHYAESLGYSDGGRFLQAQWQADVGGDSNAAHGRMSLCAWGAQGAYGLDGSGAFFAPAPRSSAAVDTLGAGDVFNAAAIDGFVRRLGMEQLLQRACRLAAEKCQTNGLDFLDAADTV